MMRRGIAIGIAFGLAAALALAFGRQASAKPPAGRPAAAMVGVPRAKAIYPEQSITLRFDHAQHLDLGVKCAQCHDKATGSNAVIDVLIDRTNVWLTARFASSG